MNDRQEIEEIELELMIDAIHRRYGHDFRDYARASLKRRFAMLASKSGVGNVGQLIPLILRDESLWEHVFLRIAVTVSEFFRDPAFFRTLKEKVFPLLATYPAIRIWHAGCANGEEVYSLAILLEEAGLLDRCTVFATDFNDRALHAAETGISEASKIENACTRYNSAGGTKTFRDYFTFSASHAKIKRHLTDAVTFANHNLVTDQSFGNMHLILCRNTFIFQRKTSGPSSAPFCREPCLPWLAGSRCPGDIAVLQVLRCV